MAKIKEVKVKEVNKVEVKKVDNSRDLIGELSVEEIARRKVLSDKAILTAVENLELARIDARAAAHREGRPVESVSASFVEAARLELEAAGLVEKSVK